MPVTITKVIIWLSHSPREGLAKGKLLFSLEYNEQRDQFLSTVFHSVQANHSTPDES